MFTTLLIGAVLGACGQGLRVLVGLKKSLERRDPIRWTLIFVSLLIGAAAGAIAAVTLGVTALTATAITAIVTAGYAGTDFIEGFAKKSTK